MSEPREVAPATLPVELSAGGVAVEYLDGREVFYHGVPSRVADEVAAAPGKEVHVLVTDADGTEGVLFYVDDRNTDDAILEDSGVGRVLLDAGETEGLFPGVEVTREGYRHRVSADLDQVDGRVFVFVEDAFTEASFEFVAAPPEEADAPEERAAREGPEP